MKLKTKKVKKCLLCKCKKIKDRKYSGVIGFKLPISRLQKNDNKLTKHPFYNFGSKDFHI